MPVTTPNGYVLHGNKDSRRDWWMVRYLNERGHVGIFLGSNCKVVLPSELVGRKVRVRVELVPDSEVIVLAEKKA